MLFRIGFCLIIVPILAPRIDQNRLTNDAKMPSLVDLIFLSQLRSPHPWRYWSWLGRTFIFLKNCPSKLISFFDPNLVLTCLHFSFKDPKSARNPIPQAIKMLINFWIDFWIILVPCWGQSRANVGHSFAWKGALEKKFNPLFYYVRVFLRFLNLIWPQLVPTWGRFGICLAPESFPWSSVSSSITFCFVRGVPFRESSYNLPRWVTSS